MKPASLPFKKVVSFQTYSCLALAFLTVILSFWGVVRVEPIFVFEDYFGEQNAEDGVSLAVTEGFGIGMIDVMVGIPQLCEAVKYDGGEFSEPEGYGSSIEKYLERTTEEDKRELTKYAYLTFAAFDESFFAGLLLLLQLFFVVYLSMVGVACAAYVAIRFAFDGKKDYFTCYQDTQRGIKPIFSALLFGIVIIAVLPNLSLSVAGYLLTACVAVFVAFNFMCLRQREHTYAQRKYLNVLQSCSLINLACTALYYIGLIASGLIPVLIGLCGIDTWELADLLLRFEGEQSHEFEDIFIAFLTGAFIFINISARKMASLSICRSFCNTQKKKFGNVIYADSFIGRAAVPLAGALIVSFLFGGGDLDFDGVRIVWLVTAAVGALLMLISEISVKVLIETVCIDLGKSGAENVLRGDVYDRRDSDA